MSDLYAADEPTKVVRTLGNASAPDDTLDPDLALWQLVRIPIWPFTGAPNKGTWPKGWLGVDNTSTLYVCTVGGTPGTWAPVGGGALYASLTGTGETNPTGSLTQTGGFTVNDPTHTGIQLLTSIGGVAIEDTGGASGGGVSIRADGGFVLASSNGVGVGVAITDASNSGMEITENGPGGIFVQTPNNSNGITLSDGGNGGITLDSGSTGGLTLEDAGGGLTIQEQGGGELLIEQTSAANTTGTRISDAGTAGVTIIATHASGPVEISCAKLGFYGAGAIAQQSSAGVTTVAQLVTILKNLGLVS